MTKVQGVTGCFGKYPIGRYRQHIAEKFFQVVSIDASGSCDQPAGVDQMAVAPGVHVKMGSGADFCHGAGAAGMVEMNMGDNDGSDGIRRDSQCFQAGLYIRRGEAGARFDQDVLFPLDNITGRTVRLALFIKIDLVHPVSKILDAIRLLFQWTFSSFYGSGRYRRRTVTFDGLAGCGRPDCVSRV
jgi:hypothetical protein